MNVEHHIIVPRPCTSTCPAFFLHAGCSSASYPLTFSALSGNSLLHKLHHPALIEFWLTLSPRASARGIYRLAFSVSPPSKRLVKAIRLFSLVIHMGFLLSLWKFPFWSWPKCSAKISTGLLLFLSVITIVLSFFLGRSVILSSIYSQMILAARCQIAFVAFCSAISLARCFNERLISWLGRASSKGQFPILLCRSWDYYCSKAEFTALSWRRRGKIHCWDRSINFPRSIVTNCTVDSGRVANSLISLRNRVKNLRHNCWFVLLHGTIASNTGSFSPNDHPVGSLESI